MTVSLFDEGPPPPCPARFNLARYVLTAAGAPAEKVALTIAEGPGAARTLGYGDLLARVAATAAGIRARTAPGDRVVLRIGHSVDFPIVFLAAAAAGAVPTPTSPMLSPGEVDYIVADTDARLIVAAADVPAGPDRPTVTPAALAEPGAAPEWADTRADDLGYIVYTSGSSGRPKGVAHAHRAVWARRMMWAGWYGLGPDDVMFHAGAFNWTYTLGAGLLDPWACGASTLIYAGPRDPAIWPALAAAHGATIFAAAPGVYRQLLKSGASLAGFAALRHALSAGETLAEAQRAAWEAKSGKPVYEALGMTEISTYLSSSPDTPPRPGRAGRPQPGRRLALLPVEGGEAPVPIGQPGVIALDRRDPGLMLGYWRDAAGTAAAMRGPWFLTGDVGVMDEDGYVGFHGRADDMMNALGYRVAPEEVEAALIAHPAVHAAAAVELPVRADLSLITAFFTPEGDEAPDEDALRRHCAQRLADYKIPKIFRMVDELPRNPNGKLKRRELIARYGFKGEAP